MSLEQAFVRLPRADLRRRSYAFVIDFGLVWLLSAIFGASQPGFPAVQLLIFILAWALLRILVVSKNQGQSLGHWAFDLKVVDSRFGKVPGLLELSKREGILGLAALLTVLGLGYGLINVGWLLLLIPLVADAGLMLSDPLRRQAVHDRVAYTMVIGTRRGYSLDLKLKRWVAQAQRRVK